MSDQGVSRRLNARACVVWTIARDIDDLAITH
jgi:hypothetical protein